LGTLMPVGILGTFDASRYIAALQKKMKGHFKNVNKTTET